MTAYLESIAALLVLALLVATISRRRAARAARAANQRLARYRQTFVELLRGDFTELDDMLLRLLRCARDTLEVERVSLWLFDEARQAITRRALVQRNLDGPAGPDRLDAATHPRYFAAVSQEFVIDADDAVHDPRTSEFARQYLQPLNIGAMLDVPMRRFGTHVGLMCIEHRGGPRNWSDHDKSFASAIAAQLTFVFEHSDLRQAREDLMTRTLHDADTGLPNAVFLRDRIEATLAAGQGCALIVANLPRMRLVVASRGRDFADQLARAVAERWRILDGDSRVLARISRDEFALLLPDQTQALAAEGWALRMSSAMAEPLLLGAERFRVEVAVGVSSCDPGEEPVADDLMAEASSAMRAAGGSGVSVFDPGMRDRAHRRLAIEQSLRQALDTRAFETWLQPIIDLETRKVVAMEALLRWRDPDHGLRSPADFLAEAIDSGLIVPIGRMAIGQTVAMYARAIREMPQLDWKLAINLAAPELLAEDLEPFLLNCLERHGVPIERLVVEVTETALVPDLDHAQRILEHLRAAGASICLDDFGTGFSSLMWLKRFPITQIKIESSFVRGIGYDPRDEAIVQSVVELARKLGQEIVAEGVENLEQLQRLRTLGVRRMQGFLFSEPFPASELSIERVARCLTALSQLDSIGASS
jgi:diguanylate cyclase